MDAQEKGSYPSRVQNATTMRLGRRIKSLRQSQGMSQHQLAERADLSSKYLGEIERGYGNISMELVSRIANSLQVPLKDIVENEHERSHDELIAEIIRLASKLNYKDAQMTYRILKMFTE